MTDRHSFEAISHRLDESTRRRRLIDQLRGPSPVRRFIEGSLSGVVTAAVYFIVSSLMRGEPSWVTITVALSVSAGLWASLDVLSLRRRLATVTTVLEESGMLEAYIDRAVPGVGAADPSPQA
ncbi:MAG TPA: hypothetical protein VFV78_00480 [Vicinamibacterales bacterium]|nr:hypothetical protein [Vicinamibacterales bacterium]